MCKNYLLSCTAAAAIVLFGAHFNVAVAEKLSIIDGGTENVEKKTYQAESADTSALYVGEEAEGGAVPLPNPESGAVPLPNNDAVVEAIKDGGGTITGKDLTLIGTNDKKGKGATVDGSNSTITLNGKTIIKDLAIGLSASKGGTITIESGTINVSDTAVTAEGKDTKITLGNVEITSTDKGLDIADGANFEMESGSIKTEKTAVTAEGKDTKITLGNVEIDSKDKGLDIADGANFNMEGGSIKTEKTAIKAKDKDTKITLANVEIDSKDKGLDIANGANFNMEGGSIKTEKTAIKADGKDTKITLANVEIDSKDKGLDIANGANFNMEGGSIKTEKTAIKADGKDTKITLGNVDLTSKGEGIHIANGAQIVANGGSITVENDNANDNVLAAIVADGQEVSVTLNDVKISSSKNGIEIDNTATLNMTGGSIKAEGYEGEGADEGYGVSLGGSESDKNKLKDTEIAVTKGVGLRVRDSKISLENVSIQSEEGRGLYASGNKTDVTMTGGTINASKAAFAVEDSAKINISNVSATASKNGLVLTNGAAADEEVNNGVNFTNTKLTVKKGVGIFREESGKDVVTLKNSEIRADLLLKYTPKEDKEAALTLNADHSVLEGRAETGEKAETVFNLSNGTIWTLKISKEEREPGEGGKPGELLDISTRSRSTVSMLNLDNSTIVFDKPTDDQYQVLHVGPAIEKAEVPALPEVGPNQVDRNANDPDNPKTVYNAKGDAKIYFNTEWSNGLTTKEQKTDRLVINGDASGTTTVYVNDIKGKNKAEKNTSVPANESGVSLIQVAGEANKDSFKLANGYATLNNSPYKYTLNAYGPEDSSHGADQSMFGEDQAYWDFRLQNAYLDSQSKVKALVPQMASYLVMPNALFSAGFSDMNQQNASLRTMSLANENNKKNAFFLSSYGNTATLSSNHTALEYGYGADLRYNALQIGVALGALENQNTTTNFGLLGTYGKVSFTPKDMEGADKSTLDKWSISAFGSIQHRNGLYLDTLLSYGLVKGHIKVANIGNVAKLSDANTLSASATIGQQFSTGVEGLVFEPQAQLAYQRLMFDSISDNDNLEIDMNNPNQWLVRIGGRLTKTVIAAENGYAVSLYGKLNMINTFGDGETIQVSGDNFHLDPMGASVESGVGINAQLNKKIGLHGDISHQHKLQKAGISATSFSGGIRYRF